MEKKIEPHWSKVQDLASAAEMAAGGLHSQLVLERRRADLERPDGMLLDKVCQLLYQLHCASDELVAVARRHQEKA